MDAQQLADLYRQALDAEEAGDAVMELPPKVVATVVVRLLQGVEGSGRVRCPSCESTDLDVLNVGEAPLVEFRCADPDCARRFRAFR